MTTVTVVSFGYLHGAPPAAHITLDLRAHFRDPHVSPELRHLTAADQAVRDAVLATPGITDLIDATVAAVAAYQAGPSAGPLTVAVGCAGGRHRAATVAGELSSRLGARLVHRDLHRPVVTTGRDRTGTAGPYDTEAQAAAGPVAAAVRALHDAGRVRSGDPDGVVRAVQLAALTAAAADAGVALGAQDTATLAWLAGWTPVTVQVVIGLIARATGAAAAH
ncbi:RNase adapter RapZ [Frankia sp. ACN1ag]|uniref:RapZ C-terminal domain-containing protein n=1 Tax=Frankia sp. ACN1ag TaxID=102891 RepID=UPI0009FAD30D|nr:RNase adapter RapZ [Frankia sp. ACN1ag]